jgi:hypothetical protein
MTWYPPQASMGAAEKVWTFFMIGIIGKPIVLRFIPV